jgi:pimeloyl-ACP methyl ester carboxylesterase
MRAPARTARLAAMLPSPSSLLGTVAAVGAVLACAPAAAHASWAGTPGKVAYLDQSSKEYPLKVYTPGLDGQGTTETIRAETFHFTDDDLVPMTTGFPSAPVWSPDGTMLAFAAKVPDDSLAPGATHTAIFTWRLRDETITQITTPPPGKPDCSCDQQLGYGFSDYAPAWSPDGQRIAFVRLQSSGDDEGIHGHDGGNIRMVPAAGGASAELTHAYGEQLYTALSWGGDPGPDGTTNLLALHGGNDAGELTLRRIDPDSGVARVELGGQEAAMIADFDVTPDGQHFDYQRYGGDVLERQIGSFGDIVKLGHGAGARMRASPTGNGPLYFGDAKVPGSDLPRGGLVEYQAPDPGGDVWAEDEKERFVNGFKAGFGQYAHTTLGRSVFDVQAQQLPIINIPGFGGSEIRCGDERLWGPSLFGTGAQLKAMELGSDGRSNAGCPSAGPPVDPNDETGFVDRVLGSKIYEAQDTFISAIAPEPRGWRFSWDWRKAPAESLERLDQLVTRALDESFARDQGVTRVVMYGHSYGGMLMREYQNAHPERLARALTVGTPYWGATKPLNFATFGLENPLSGPLDLDTLMPNAAAKAFARNLAGLYWLVPSDHYGPWLKVAGVTQSQGGVRDFFVDGAGGNGALVDAGLAWHHANDGFSTTRGNVEVRAVVGTGLPTIEAIDVSNLRPGEGGDLEVALHLGQGDVTVPIRSASQGDLGTHDPLGEDVHAQAVCGVGHMELGGVASVTEPYTDYLLRGRTPRKTEGFCDIEATEIVVKTLDAEPRGARAAASATGLSLDAAAAAGKIQLLRYPGAPVAIVDERHPVTLDVAGPGQPVELRITRWKGSAQQQTVTYRPGAGAVQVATGPQGPVVTVDGRVVAGEGQAPESGGQQGGGGSGAPSRGGGAAPPTPPATAPANPAAPVTGATTTAPKAKPKPAPKATKKVCKTIKKKVKGKTRKVKVCTTVKPKPKPKAKPTKPKAKRRR